MGLTVESIQAGDGKHYPMKLQTVTLHYVGYLDRAGEKQFDSTFERGILHMISLKNEE
jgi:FKBP-type peptidyl-prolyl cis-trans isomerase